MRFMIAAATAVVLVSTTAVTAQVVRPSVNIPVAKPTIKLPGVTPTPTPTPTSTQSSGHSTIPANVRTSTITVTGTEAGPEPTASPLVTIAERRDFNLTVPLRISHLPSMFTDVTVDCQVSSAVNPSSPDVSSLDHLVGEGMNGVRLTNGGYVGDVEVHPFTNAGYDPTTGQIYHCFVILNGTDRGTAFHARPERRYRGAPWTYEPPVATTGTLQPEAAGLIP